MTFFLPAVMSMMVDDQIHAIGVKLPEESVTQVRIQADMGQSLRDGLQHRVMCLVIGDPVIL